MRTTLATIWLWYAACGEAHTIDPVALGGSYLMALAGLTLLGYSFREAGKG
jgi:hypothetical protein